MGAGMGPSLGEGASAGASIGAGMGLSEGAGASIGAGMGLSEGATIGYGPGAGATAGAGMGLPEGAGGRCHVRCLGSSRRGGWHSSQKGCIPNNIVSQEGHTREQDGQVLLQLHMILYVRQLSPQA